MKYYLGVDIGGSKSHALIADENGQALGFGKAGGGNWEGVGYEGYRSVLNEIVAQAVDAAGITRDQIAGAGFGIGGFDWPCQVENHRQVIQSLELAAPFDFVNDTLIGLFAGASEPWGVAVVSGTGCNCWGIDRQGRVGHVSGEGTYMGEEGGSGSLIMRAVQAISRQWSKRGPATRLTEAFLERTGAKDLALLLEGLMLQRYHLDPGDVKIVFRVAEEGDAVAQQIVTWNGEQLADLVLGVVRQLEMQADEFELVLVGSLFKVGECMIGPMRKAILVEAPGARLVKLPALPVIGGVVLAMKTAGIDPRPVHPVLVETVKRFMD